MEEVVAVIHHRSHYQIIVAGIVCEPPILHDCLFELIALFEASGGYIPRGTGNPPVIAICLVEDTRYSADLLAVVERQHAIKGGLRASC
jgi:hypothetical protein